MAMRGFKQKCNQHYRELILGVSSVALINATNKTSATNRTQHRRKTAEVKTAPTAFSLPAASMTSYCCAKVSYSAGWTICTTTRAVC